jgi:hypothetical protein
LAGARHVPGLRAPGGEDGLPLGALHESGRDGRLPRSAERAGSPRRDADLADTLLGDLRV